MESCPFCAIVKNQLPAELVYEDEYALAFRDIRPQAPVHVLVIPKEHVASLNDTAGFSDRKLAECLRAIPVIAAQEGLTGGYRVVSNCGPDACQSVPHLHFHILGGTQLADRMA